MDIYHSQEKTIIGYRTVKTASKNVIHKGGESFGNIIAGTVTKSNDDKIVEQEPAEEIIIPLEKRGEILDKLRKVL